MMQASQSTVPANGVILQQAGQPRQTAGLPRKVPGLLVLAILHIVLGVLATALGIVAIIIQSAYYPYATGIWSGVLFFVVTGVLGFITVATKMNKCMIISFMIMSIITSVDSFVMLLHGAVGASIEHYNPYCYTYDPYSEYESCSVSVGARLAVDVAHVVVALGELVICILGASFSCYGICNCGRNSTTEGSVQFVAQQQQQNIPTGSVQPPLQMQSLPAPTLVQGNLAGPSYAVQSMMPTQPMGQPPHLIGIPQQQPGRITPTQTDVLQQQSGRITPQHIDIPQQQQHSGRSTPQPVGPTPTVGTPLQQSWGPLPTQVGGIAPQQVGVASQQVGLPPQQAVFAPQPTASQDVGSTPQQVGSAFQQVGATPQQVGMATQDEGIPPQPEAIAAAAGDTVLAASVEDGKEAAESRGIDNMEELGGDEFNDDKQVLIEIT